MPVAYIGYFSSAGEVNNIVTFSLLLIFHAVYLRAINIKKLLLFTTLWIAVLYGYLILQNENYATLILLLSGPVIYITVFGGWIVNKALEKSLSNQKYVTWAIGCIGGLLITLAVGDNVNRRLVSHESSLAERFAYDIAKHVKANANGSKTNTDEAIKRLLLATYPKQKHGLGGRVEAGVSNENVFIEFTHIPAGYGCIYFAFYYNGPQQVGFNQVYIDGKNTASLTRSACKSNNVTIRYTVPLDSLQRKDLSSYENYRLNQAG